MARDVTTRIGVEDRASRKIKKSTESVTAYGRAWRNTARVTERAMRGMDRGFALINRSMGRLMRRAKFMMLGLQLTAVIMGTQMVRSAMKYERALRNVTSLLAGGGMSAVEVEKRFRAMSKSIREMSVEIGVAPQQMAEAMYEITSTGFDPAADGLKVMEAASLGAFAGLTDVNTVTALLTQSLRAYQRAGEDNNSVAEKSMSYMDQFFQAVNVGVFSFEELAQKFGSITSTGAAFNVEMKDLLAFLATATVRGVDLDESITGLRQTLLSIVSMSPAQEAAALELFGKDWESQWSGQALAADGLYGVLQGLQDVLPEIPPGIIDAAVAMEDEGGDAAAFLAEQIGGTITQLAALFPNVRALKGVLAVTGPGMEVYADNIAAIGDSAGATQRAQDEMAKSAEGAMQFVKAAWENFKIDAGGIVLPFLKEVADGFMTWWGGIPQRFAAAQGLTPDDLIQKFGLVEGKALFEEEVGNLWADATPGERVGFILKDAWKQGMDALVTWFEGGGEGRVEALGAALANSITGIMDAVAGVDKEGMQDNIGYRFGKAFIEGFKEAWSEWVEGGGMSSFLQSGIGRIGSAVIGGAVGGPGGAVGGYLGSGSGSAIGTGAGVLGGAAAWKGISMIVGKVLAGSGAGAGAAGAGAGAAGAGLTAGAWAKLAATSFGKFVGAISMPLQVAGLGALGMGALTNAGLNAAIEKQTAQMATDREEAFSGQVDRLIKTGFTAEGAKEFLKNELPSITTAAGNPVYGFGNGGMGGAGIDWSAIQQSGALAGLGGPTGNGSFEKLEDSSSTYLTATRNFEGAVSRLTNWKFPGPGGGGSGGGGSKGGSSQGGYGDNQKMAAGGSGTVRRPTWFLAGEAGPEDYNFTPTYKGKGGSGGVTIQGPLMAGVTIGSDMDVKRVTAEIVRELEKAVNNG